MEVKKGTKRWCGETYNCVRVHLSDQDKEIFKQALTMMTNIMSISEDIKGATKEDKDFIDDTLYHLALKFDKMSLAFN